MARLTRARVHPIPPSAYGPSHPRPLLRRVVVQTHTESHALARHPGSLSAIDFPGAGDTDHQVAIHRLRRPPTSSLPVTLTDRHSQARLSPIVLSDASGSHNGFLCDTFLRYGRTDFMKYQPLPVYHARRRQLCF